MSNLFAKFLLGDSFQEDAAPPPPQGQPGNPNDPANMVAPTAPPPDMTGGGAPPAGPNAGEAAPQAPGPDMGTPPPDPSGAGAAMPPGPPDGGGMDPSMGGAPPQGDPNAGAPMDPNGQPADPNAQGDPNAMQDPNAAPPPPDGGDPAGDDNMAPPTDINTDIENAEKEVFSDLKPEQQIIQKTELKERYQELHKALISTLDKINKVSHTSYDDVMLDFIVKKLVNLKTMVADSLINAFPTRSYFDNKVELQRFVRSFNYATSLLTKVYEARLKRQQAIAKMNSKKGFEKAPEAFPIFNRGYDVQ